MAGIAASITSTSSPVVSMGCARRRSHITRAICTAQFSSPHSRSTRASSSCEYSFTTVRAVSAWERSMRMSSGASAWYENPRAPSSS